MIEEQNALTHGVYLITTTWQGRRYGMTCSWATQIDADRIMLVPGKQSSTGTAIRQSGRFGVNIPGENQRELALRFGSHHSNSKDQFANTSLVDDGAAPLFQDVNAHLVCEVDHSVNCSDNGLVLGRILKIERSTQQRPPLLLEQVNV